MNISDWLDEEKKNPHKQKALENASRYFDEKDELNVKELKFEEKLCEFINNKCVNNSTSKWIFRGHGDIDWELQPILFRNWKNPDPKRHEEIQNFFIALLIKYGIISEKDIKEIKYDKPILQYGQHYRLWTNILDWTMDYKIALEFAKIQAYKEWINERSYSTKICIFALSVFNDMVDKPQRDGEDNTILSVFDPKNWLKWENSKNNNTYNYGNLLAKNERIKKQKGLFTYTKGTIINEQYINKSKEDYENNNINLYKLIIPFDLEKFDIKKANKDVVNAILGDEMTQKINELNKEFNVIT